MWTQISVLLPEQSDLNLHYLSKRLQLFKQTTKAYDCFVICALSSDIYGQDYQEMHAR